MPREFEVPLGNNYPYPQNIKHMMGMQKINCHKCGEEGHKSTFCQEPKLDDHLLAQKVPLNHNSVTCFSCYEKGHYANACPQKHLKNQAAQ